jgi:hypothetical protein
MIDITARHIYDYARPAMVNSWLRALASIRALPVSELGERRPV